MTDLVEQLREEGLGFGIGPALLCYQAAEEIERLRKEAMSDYHEGWEEGYAALKAENVKLREAIKKILDDSFGQRQRTPFTNVRSISVGTLVAVREALGETDN